MSTTDTRIKSILQWLIHSLKLEVSDFEPASSDASFRRYFRVTHHHGQQIVMDAPPETEDTKQFIQTASLFKKIGVNVPEIYHQNQKQGFLLLEDFGSICFLDQLNDRTAEKLYQSAFNSLFKLQAQSSLTSKQLPHYDVTKLSSELDIFYQWFLEQFLKLHIPNNIKKTLNTLLIQSAIEQPQVCVHRDFHSRNLMVTAKDSPGIIDFQDAVIGPISYDLVSLLRDCYIAWPEEKVALWMEVYFHKIAEAGLINVNLKTFTRWFDLMGLQRHLKAIGIFSRLHLRDHKSDYLADIPRTIAYVKLICHKYPELADFNQILIQNILPAYKNK